MVRNPGKCFPGILGGEIDLEYPKRAYSVCVFPLPRQNYQRITSHKTSIFRENLINEKKKKFRTVLQFLQGIFGHPHIPILFPSHAMPHFMSLPSEYLYKQTLVTVYTPLQKNLHPNVKKSPHQSLLGLSPKSFPETPMREAPHPQGFFPNTNTPRNSERMSPEKGPIHKGVHSLPSIMFQVS